MKKTNMINKLILALITFTIFSCKPSTTKYEHVDYKVLPGLVDDSVTFWSEKENCLAIFLTGVKATSFKNASGNNGVSKLTLNNKEYTLTSPTNKLHIFDIISDEKMLINLPEGFVKSFHYNRTNQKVLDYLEENLDSKNLIEIRKFIETIKKEKS